MKPDAAEADEAGGRWTWLQRLRLTKGLWVDALRWENIEQMCQKMAVLVHGGGCDGASPHSRVPCMAVYQDSRDVSMHWDFLRRCTQRVLLIHPDDDVLTLRRLEEQWCQGMWRDCDVMFSGLGRMRLSPASYEHTPLRIHKNAETQVSWLRLQHRSVQLVLCWNLASRDTLASVSSLLHPRGACILRLAAEQEDALLERLEDLDLAVASACTMEQLLDDNLFHPLMRQDRFQLGIDHNSEALLHGAGLRTRLRQWRIVVLKIKGTPQ